MVLSAFLAGKVYHSLSSPPHTKQVHAHRHTLHVSTGYCGTRYNYMFLHSSKCSIPAVFSVAWASLIIQKHPWIPSSFVLFHPGS